MSLWLLCLLALAPPDDGWPAGGPLRFPNVHPLHGIFLDTPALDAALPAKPSLDFSLYHFNTWARSSNLAAFPAGLAFLSPRAPGEPRHELDAGALAAQVAASGPTAAVFVADTETTRLELTYTHPFSARWAAAIEVPVLAHHGGTFDQVIERFHEWFGYPSDNRPVAAVNRTRIFYARGGESRFYTGSLSPSLGDIVIRGMHAPMPETATQPAVMLSAAVKFPTGAASRFAGSGRWDAGLAIHARKTLGDFRVYGTLGHNWHGGWSGLPATPTRNTFDLHLGGSWQFASGWAFDVTGSIQEHALGDVFASTLNKRAYIIGGGVRHNLGDGLVFEGGFFENIAENANSYDTGLMSRIRWTP